MFNRLHWNFYGLGPSIIQLHPFRFTKLPPQKRPHAHEVQIRFKFTGLNVISAVFDAATHGYYSLTQLENVSEILYLSKLMS